MLQRLRPNRETGRKLSLKSRSTKSLDVSLSRQNQLSHAGKTSFSSLPETNLTRAVLAGASGNASNSRTAPQAGVRQPLTSSLPHVRTLAPWPNREDDTVTDVSRRSCFMTPHRPASLRALSRALPVCKPVSECLHDQLLLTAISLTHWSYFGYFEPLTLHGVKSGMQTRLPVTLGPEKTGAGALRAHWAPRFLPKPTILR